MQTTKLSAEALEARREFCKQANIALDAIRDLNRQWDASIRICQEAIPKAA